MIFINIYFFKCLFFNIAEMSSLKTSNFKISRGRKLIFKLLSRQRLCLLFLIIQNDQKGHNIGLNNSAIDVANESYVLCQCLIV